MGPFSFFPLYFYYKFVSLQGHEKSLWEYVCFICSEQCIQIISSCKNKIWAGSTVFVHGASNTFVGDKNIHFVIIVFWGLINVSSMCIRLEFSWNARTFARPKQLIIQIEPDFPCLADEIAEPRPFMNIKVTTFLESKKFYYTCIPRESTFR